MRSTLSTRSSGSSRGSTSSRKVRRGSRADTTTGARSSVPSSSTTPDARPSVVSTLLTRAPNRISAPCASAARATTCVNPPLPPLWNAHDPRCPSCSPILWNSSTRPEPGDIGPTFEPMMLEEAWKPLTASCSK